MAAGRFEPRRVTGEALTNSDAASPGQGTEAGHAVENGKVSVSLVVAVVATAVIVIALAAILGRSGPLSALWHYLGDDSVEHLREEDVKLNQRLDSYHDELSQQEQRIVDQGTQLRELDQSLTREAATNSEQSDRLEELEQSVRRLQTLADEQRKALDALSTENHAQSDRLAQLESLKGLVRDQAESIAALEEAIESIRRERSTDQDRLRRIEQILGLEPTP